MHTKLVHSKTEDSVTTTIVSDGGKNTVYLVSGVIRNKEDSSFDVVDLSKLAGNPVGIRLDSISFLIETGLRVYLKYRDQPYTIPLEGRSKVDLSWVGGIIGHEIDLVCKGTGALFVVLDVSKMGV
jgi:hypothetical protein